MSRSNLLDRLAQPRALAAIFAAIMAFVAITSIPAEARRHRTHHFRHHVAHRHYYHAPRHAYSRHFFRRARYAGGGGEVGRYHGFSGIVIDANSGRPLWSHSEHELRHPASVTKVMTLYLLFEQLERGRLRLDSPLMISEHAAAQAPSKLGLAPGETISVENAIKAVVTKSANDIACAIAENIGGDEHSFAQMMTRKAHSLGMRNTHYENASGLPDPDQVTTAYDLSLLGRAIQDRYPRYYRYFSTHSFAYNGALHRNHNHLLGRIEGMDGIKTGYTRASGFNLLTSVHRDGHHIVAVVLGGRTAGERDRIMAHLIEDHIGDGAGMRTARAVTEDGGEEQVAAAEPDREAEQRAQAELRSQQERQARQERLAAQSAAEQQRAERAAFAEAEEVEQTATIDEEQEAAPRSARRALAIVAPRPSAPPRVAAAPAVKTEKIVKAEKAVRPAFVSGIQKLIEDTEKTSRKARDKKPVATAAVVDGSTTKVTRTRDISVSGATPAAVKSAAKVDLVRPKTAGWMIQIGAAEDPDKAGQLLSRARSQLRGFPAGAQAFTEKVQKGNTTLYRARFAGLEEQSAKSACDALKSSGFACFTTKN